MNRRRLLQLAAAAPVAALVPAIAVPMALPLPVQPIPNAVMYEPMAAEIAETFKELIAYGEKVFGSGWGDEFIRNELAALPEGVRSAEALKQAYDGQPSQ